MLIFCKISLLFSTSFVQSIYVELHFEAWSVIYSVPAVYPTLAWGQLVSIEKIKETLERKNQLDCNPVGGREVHDGEIASFAD